MKNFSVWHWLLVVSFALALVWPVIVDRRNRRQGDERRDVRAELDRLAPHVQVATDFAEPDNVQRKRPPILEILLVILILVSAIIWLNWQTFGKVLGYQLIETVSRGVAMGAMLTIVGVVTTMARSVWRSRNLGARRLKFVMLVLVLMLIGLVSVDVLGLVGTLCVVFAVGIGFWIIRGYNQR